MTEMSLNAKKPLSYLPVMLLRRLIYFKHVVAGAVGIMMHSGQKTQQEEWKDICCWVTQKIYLKQSQYYYYFNKRQQINL